MVRLLSLIALAALLPGSPAFAGNSAEQRGAALLKPFKEELMGALRDGMQKGPAEAVSTCHLQAPDIPGATAPEGVKMGRTSHKLRNPDNAPTDWQNEILAYYLNHEDRSPRIRKLDDGRMAYAEPIGVKPLCLTCHGDRKQIPEPVKAKLDELYPNDEATGFEAGDFRGVFWVTWPTDI